MVSKYQKLVGLVNEQITGWRNFFKFAETQRLLVDESAAELSATKISVIVLSDWMAPTFDEKIRLNSLGGV